MYKAHSAKRTFISHFKQCFPVGTTIGRLMLQRHFSQGAIFDERSRLIGYLIGVAYAGSFIAFFVTFFLAFFSIVFVVSYAGFLCSLIH
jgi:hypothetical protein